MIESIKIQYPAYFIGFCLLTGLVFALALYFRSRKNREDTPAYLPYLLGFLRGVAVGAIAYFLLIPIIERFKARTQDPIVVVATDRSSSIVESMGDSKIQDLNNGLDQLITVLAEDYDVQTLTFGEKVEADGADSTWQKSTDISELFEYIENQYSDQHIGAVIVATDGIFNEGRNPLYVGNGITAPLYPVALGDTTTRRDILIKNLLYNKIAYLGDETELQVDVQATNASGASTTLNVSKLVDGKPISIENKAISIAGGDFFKTYKFMLEATTPGKVQYQVSLSQVSDEISKSNNTKTAYLDVIDARQDVFIIANAPHPDVHALKQSLSINKNYKISTYYPDDNIPFEKVDLAILHNLPSPKFPAQNILSKLDSRKKPRIYILGGQTDFRRANAAALGLKVQGVIGQTNESQAELVGGFNAFTLRDKIRNAIRKYPPLITPFGEYDLSSTAEVLLKQKINGISTDYPLLAFDQSQGVRKVFIAGEGIWKWRLFNFLQDKNHESFDELFRKIAQYASVKDDKRKFRVNIAKNEYQENEDIYFDAQLFNDVYEMINVPETQMTIKDKAGQNYSFTFTRTNDYYTLNVGALSEGQYSYTATTSYNGVAMKDSGSFTVEAIQKESYNLQADHGLLYQLAKKYQGSVLYPEQMDQIPELLGQSNAMKPLVFQEKDNRLLMHFPWLVIPIILLLGIEWFVRRYIGGY